MSLTDRTIPTDVALNTDLYELTMAQGFWESGLVDTQACFNVFFRENPFGGGYAVAAGTGQIADLVENFTFDADAITYLASLEAPGGGAMFKQGFLDYLSAFRADLDVWAVPEGDVVFPREPLVRVTGPAIACQLVETALLNLVNFQTLVATKTARVVQAAEGHMVSDFGLRRAQGPDGGLAVARASYIGGATSTSNCLAGKIYGIPVFGTHAHSWVMAFPTELEAFRAFAKSSPKNCVLLVDTYDVRRGLANAITVAHEMEAAGERLAAIRIDSGDLAKLSKLARRMFDDAGLPYVKVSVSNDLDEYTIQSLFAQGAPIDSFGVGTKLATCDPQPSLGGVYKLSATRAAGDTAWTPVIKLSEMSYKRTIPGVQHVLRYTDEAGCPVGDRIVDDSVVERGSTTVVDVLDPVATYDLAGATPHELMVQVVAAGTGTPTGHEPLDDAKARCRDSLMHLDPAVRRFLNPQIYPVGMDEGLARLRSDLAREERASSGRPMHA
ncbi:MAG: nicotinate phosphoribosyltransferase [Atopobiaceae bacterium]|jgi:nicotinate phosphoribosyltransferase|nr:nicotinate phosphoribosyltransferase [Atopobiaceae bacterium]MCH4181052.1 nicotinate phosphoribosyltransferase [Atopobiaceae bacterium]MCH4213744.1 nicotinate phosphoribosyltransferase [Atopobiaceae bacterium]MCH4230332.1 nicotinate phosphoribosyltransferase [Atopobiaceae bacterium]MCH4277030.1 nicotinate phosphoribosyltransferase [Atopobiaceae bacterium]